VFGRWGQITHYNERGQAVCSHQRLWRGCPDCSAVRTPTALIRQWRKENPDKQQRMELKKYGVTLEWYEKQYHIQKGCCAICGKPETTKRNGIVKRLAVDHNHDESGFPRGLLCYRCNVNLAVLEDFVWCAKARVYIAAQGF
jgi:Recombination endonuclease VII